LAVDAAKFVHWAAGAYLARSPAVDSIRTGRASAASLVPSRERSQPWSALTSTGKQAESAIAINATRGIPSRLPSEFSSNSHVASAAPMLVAKCDTADWMDMKRARSASCGTRVAKALKATMRVVLANMKPTKIPATGTAGCAGKKENASTAIFQYLRRRLPEVHQSNRDFDLLDHQVVDSLRMMKIIVLLEKLTGEPIPLDQVKPEDFRSISQITARFLQKLDSTEA
jgi:acyl carrier protein